MKKHLAAAIVILSTFGAIVASAQAANFECICVKKTGADCSTSVEVHSGRITDAADAGDDVCKFACISGQGIAAADLCSSSWKPTTSQDVNTTKPPVDEGGPVKLKNPLNASNVPQLVSNILRTAMSVVGALALLVFIYGGLRWLTSAGEPAKIQAGKDAMKWAAIGLVVIFSSYALVSFVFGSLTSL